MRLKSLPMSSTVAFNKDAFPTAGAHRQRTRSSCLPKQALCSCVIIQAQYQAFVHVAVGKQRTSTGHRA
jgi:hypothetical protein